MNTTTYKENWNNLVHILYAMSDVEVEKAKALADKLDEVLDSLVEELKG